MCFARSALILRHNWSGTPPSLLLDHPPSFVRRPTLVSRPTQNLPSSASPQLKTLTHSLFEAQTLDLLPWIRFP